MSQERQIRAQFLQVGTQLHTPDGWQRIHGVLAHAEDAKSLDQVTVYTPQRTLDDSNGWTYRFNDLVLTRGEVPGEDDCPSWCVEHYRGGDRLQEKNCSSFPQSVTVVEACTGIEREFGFWAEQRVNRETGTVERVGILESKYVEDVELSAGGLRNLADNLRALAHMVEETP